MSKKLYKTVTKRTTALMVKKGVLKHGNYVLTKNYLAVPGEDAENAYKYLEKHGYGGSGENFYHKGEHQISVIYINEM